MKSLAGLFILMLFSPEQPPPVDVHYFPKSVFFRKDLELSDSVAEGLSERLRILKEPSLWKLSQNEPATEVYRFFWSASIEQSISFRLTKAGDKSTLFVSQFVEEGGKDPKETFTLRTIALTAKQWDEAVILLNKTPFWSAPTSVKESRGIADGDKIVIEAVKKGRYRVIDRAGCMTSESYKSFCHDLIRISGSPMINVWDKRREAERKLLDYKREYKETEDTGETEGGK